MDETLVEQPVKGRGLGPDCQRETTGRVGKAVVQWRPAE